MTKPWDEEAWQRQVARAKRYNEMRRRLEQNVANAEELVRTAEAALEEAHRKFAEADKQLQDFRNDRT